MKIKELPELLLPAGSIEKAYTAFRYGADAIYCGCPMFSLRTRENNFTEENIAEIIQYVRNLPEEKGNGRQRKKVYVTLNAFPHQFAINSTKKHLEFLNTVQPDGIIFADWGVLALANQICPNIPKHLSVQTSTMNEPAIRMWQKLGVERIITAREMSIKEVATIGKLIPEMEFEYFVHGAVCMAYSGRCLLSNFTGGRDANRGTCNHTCRWNYRVYDEDSEVDVTEHYNKGGCCGIKEGKSREIHEFETGNLIEEEQRQGEMVRVEEDFHGTHIMSSRDMAMIEYLNEIIEAGVCSLKVEGRNKTGYYLATVGRAYRQALDDIFSGKEFNPKLWEELQATANRGFFPGFLHGKPREGDIQYEANKSFSEKEFCGVVLKSEKGRIEVKVKNRIFAGNEIEVVMPKIADDFSFTAEEMMFGEEQVEALHGGNDNQIASLKCEKGIPVGTFLRQKVIE